jgi:hypothetical protein
MAQGQGAVSIYNLKIFALVLQTAQQSQMLAKQVAPNVYVAIQPPPGGMPEWLKVLTSAAVGALVGIISNIAMEYVKPWIAQHSLKKKVTVQIVSELAANYSKIQSAIRALNTASSDESEATSMAISEAILEDMDVDRYEFNFANNKALVYEIDPKGRITTAYKALRKAKTAADKLHYRLMISSFRMAAIQVQIFFKEHNIPLVETETIFDNLTEHGRVVAGHDA